MRYPLLATCLEEKDCDRVMAPALTSAMGSMKLARSFPKAVLHGPRELQGLAVPHLYTVQGLQHLAALTKYPKAGGRHGCADPGKLMRCSIEHLKLELGVNGSVMSNPYDPWKTTVTPCWMSHTWAFVSKAGMSVRDDIPDFSMRREHDSLLMEHFVERFSGIELCRLNQCRQYLRVIRVSDIASGDGKTITEDAWNGNLAGNVIGTGDELEWPRRPPIGNSVRHWTVWKKALRFLCGNLRKVLRRPLGRWYSDDKWEWYVDPTNDGLYQRLGDQWRTFRPLRRTASTRAVVLRFDKKPILTTNPTNAQMAVVFEQPASLTVSHFGPTIARPTRSIRTGLAQFVPEASAWVLENVCMPRDGGRYLSECIQDGSVRCVSDGSEKDGVGTAAFVLCGGNKELRLTGACVVPGEASDQSSTRSEQMGLYALGLVTLALVRKFGINEGAATMGCDGAISLSSTFRDKDYDAEKNNFDLVIATKNVMAETGIKWTSKWIKGHKKGKLDVWEQLNALVDREANRFRDEVWDGRRHWGVAHEPWEVWIGDRKVCRDFKKSVTDHIQGNKLKEYWRKRGAAGENTDLVAWEEAAGAVKKLTKGKQVALSKFSADQAPVRKILMRREHATTAECPRCKAESEDVEHMLTCPDAEAQKRWDSAIQAVEATLSALDTAPDITRAICIGLNQWRQGVETEVPMGVSADAQEAFTMQSDIGWKNLVLGRPARAWVHTQQRYWDDQNRPNSVRRWMTAVLEQFFDIAWDQWEHRNGRLHHKEESLLVDELHDNMRREFQLGIRNLGLGKALAPVNEDALLMKPFRWKERWLKRVQAARKVVRDTDWRYQARDRFRRWATTTVREGNDERSES